MLKHETEENITEYLKQQGVTACKRFTIKKDENLIVAFTCSPDKKQNVHYH